MECKKIKPPKQIQEATAVVFHGKAIWLPQFRSGSITTKGNQYPQEKKPSKHLLSIGSTLNITVLRSTKASHLINEKFLKTLIFKEHVTRDGRHVV
jgi:hypothetical protein